MLNDTMGEIIHEPVMLNEAMEYLDPRPGGCYIDATVGSGGHALRILELSAPDGKLVAFDKDKQALQISEQRLAEYKKRIRFIHSDFRDMKKHVLSKEYPQIHGILFDLGLSALHVDDASRGFSFSKAGPIDMRMDKRQQQTAWDILCDSSVEKLAQIIRTYGEQSNSRRIAAAIKKAIAERRLHDTRQLANVIASAIHNKDRKSNIHPATRVFQALRIATNDELTNLKHLFVEAARMLVAGGRMVIISYQSLEDRKAKEAIKHLSSACICPADAPFCACGHEPEVKALTSRVVKPSLEEIKRNPRARSAKLRAIERI